MCRASQIVCVKKLNNDNVKEKKSMKVLSLSSFDAANVNQHPVQTERTIVSFPKQITIPSVLMSLSSGNELLNPVKQQSMHLFCRLEEPRRRIANPKWKLPTIIQQPCHLCRCLCHIHHFSNLILNIFHLLNPQFTRRHCP